ncbi:unnamed protein product [Penicillium viridicatum]
MSQFNRNGCDYDSEGLPLSVRRVERERFHLSVDLSEYFVFFIDDSTFQTDFVDPNTIPIRGIRCTFNPQTNTLIVKMMTFEHLQVVHAINRVIYGVLEPMGLGWETFSYDEVNININGMSKQPDWALGPRHPPPGTGKRPMVVAEIAFSQTRRLQRDIDLWLDPSRGNTNVAIAIKTFLLRVSQIAHTSLDRHHLDMDHDGDEDHHSGIPQNIGKGGTTSSRAMSAALAQHRTRRRRGSLRKTALLGTRLESRDKRATAKAAEALEALRAESSRLPAADLQADIQPKDQTPSDNGATQYSPRESVALDDDRDDTQQPTWFRAANTQIPTRPSISRRRQSLAQHNLQEQATDDEDLVSFPPLHSNSTPTAAGTGTSPKIISAGLHISPPSSSSGSFYSLQPQPEPAYLPVHRHKSSPLATHPVEMKSSPDVDIDYSETEWWGWIILIVTWLVFVVGIGSCFEVWSWAWDVGETPYAPPELEDDPTLPIVGYYPALIILTAVMSWVWVVVAWVGMKYFKHANISGEDI